MAALQPCLLACAVALAAGGGVSAYYDAESPASFPPLPLLERVMGGAGLPADRLARRHGWLDAPDPRLYMLAGGDEVDDAAQVGAAAGMGAGVARAKRTGLGGGPSLSIVNPLDVLRQRLLLEIARRRMRQSEEKIEANRQFLKTIGKRAADPAPAIAPDEDDDDAGAKMPDASRWSKES